MRSSANSRVRWATVIENVLKIRNAPTNSEIPANASSAIFRKPRLLRMSEDCLAASCSPVRTCTDAGSDARSSSESFCGETPGFAATSIVSKPFLSSIRWASGRVSSSVDAPPKPTPAISVTPTSR